MSATLRPPPVSTNRARVEDRPRPLRVRRVAQVIIALLLVWVVAVAVTGTRSAASLQQARSGLAAAEAALADGDLAAASRQLSAAEGSAARAADRLEATHLVPLRSLPVSGPNLRAAGRLAEATRDVSRHGRVLLDELAVELGDDPPVASTPLARVARLRDPLRTLADHVARSMERVTETASPQLLVPVAEANAAYLAAVATVQERVEVAADLAEQLPVLLGADEPKQYLVTAGTLSELRGSGGLLGSFSVMTASQGRLSFEPFAGVDELEALTGSTDVAPPNLDHAARYGHLGGLRHWRNANLSADFPANAEVLLALWESSGQAPLDGVVAADSVAFERLVERSGPVEVPGVGTLTAQSARDFIGLEAYAAFETQDERKRVLGAVATSAFDRVSELVSGRDLRATATLLAGLTRDGHLRIHSRDAQVQAALVRAGAAGAIGDAPGEFTAVVVNNVAGNKVDFFTQRTVEHEVRLLPGGSSEADVTATFRNDAPREGLPAYVLGPAADGAEAGDNRSLVTFLCGIGCTFTSLPPGVVPAGVERDHPAADTWLDVPAGEQRSVMVSTRTPGAWRSVDDGVELTVRHRGQPTATSDTVRITVTVPPAARAVVLPEGARRSGDHVVWESSDGTADLVLHYRFEGWTP